MKILSGIFVIINVVGIISAFVSNVFFDQHETIEAAFYQTFLSMSPFILGLIFWMLLLIAFKFKRKESET
ncbi:hypothetical protein KP77_04910 [Jeotgalibacillus alimentarius]|uniref:Uncharacterized protein n=1 Tax=Jeotgalibacillus alimentarius TaxID=135826 RepID=A0A0C2RTH8_9BACL|nr:hypothetical protein KP77_04910 [Jeotgalibacillus alimentarius]